METADRAAGDGDEAERKILPAKIGPLPSTKRVNAGSSSCGCTKKIPSPSSSDDADLDEGAEIVTRREQQPDGQRARDEAIDDDGCRERHRAVGEPGCQRRALCDGLAAEDARNRRARSRSASTRALARTQVAQVQPMNTAMGIVARS
jgi:hypothetical protein